MLRARHISSPRLGEKVARRADEGACSPSAPKGEDNSASPLLPFQSLTRKHLPAYPRLPIPLHHLSCNRNGRAIRAALFADRLPASTSMVLADHVSERRPAMPAAGGADPVGAVKRLSPMDRHSGSQNAARQMQDFPPHSTPIRICRAVVSPTAAKPLRRFLRA